MGSNIKHYILTTDINETKERQETKIKCNFIWFCHYVMGPFHYKIRFAF
jgi:hypothetical protein